MEPEILLVDTVLAVSDFAFQNIDAWAKMEGFVSSRRTVGFVSYILGVIKELGHRTIILKNGDLDFLEPDEAERNETIR